MTMQPQPTGTAGETSLKTDPAAETTEGTTSGAQAIVGRSPGRAAWLRLRRDRMSVVALVVSAFFVVVALVAPLLAKLGGWGPTDSDGKAINPDQGMSPIGSLGGISAHHLLGVEPGTGFDLFARVLYGLRTSLGVGLIAAILSTVMGVVVGLAAGYFGGKTDTVLSRIMDVVLAFPQILFIISLTPVIENAVRTDNHGGSSESLRLAVLIVIISFFAWAYTARIIRGQVLSMREREFIEAARIMGAGWGHILFRQLLPNLWAPILITFALAVPTNVATEAGLSFLGVGVVPPNPDLGNLLTNASDYFLTDPMYMFVPGVLLLIFVLSLNLLGDGVRDALDPKASRS